jgi:hypothetical protein
VQIQHVGHPGEVQQGDQTGDDPAGEKDIRPERSPVDRRFAAIIGDLCAADPPFARRVAEARRLRSGQITMLTGLLATLLFGVVPLACGIQTGLALLLTLGAVGIAFLPILVPSVVSAVLTRVRPAW